MQFQYLEEACSFVNIWEWQYEGLKVAFVNLKAHFCGGDEVAEVRRKWPYCCNTCTEVSDV